MGLDLSIYSIRHISDILGRAGRLFLGIAGKWLYYLAELGHWAVVYMYTFDACLVSGMV